MDSNRIRAIEHLGDAGAGVGPGDRVYGRVMKYLKRYHMLHHFKTPEKRYGVSSPLWDMVFGTAPKA